jgi:hypothetical protein
MMATSRPLRAKGEGGREPCDPGADNLDVLGRHGALPDQLGMYGQSLRLPRMVKVHPDGTVCAVSVKRRIELVERGAIGADLFGFRAHVEELMRMIEGRVGAHAHELLDPDLDCGMPGIVLKMRDFVASHASLRRGVLDLAGPYTLQGQKCSGYLVPLLPEMPVEPF